MIVIAGIRGGDNGRRAKSVVNEYHVKWRLVGRDKIAEHYVRNERRPEALDFACAVLHQKRQSSGGPFLSPST